MRNTFTIKTRRLHSLVVFIFGVALLLVTVDAHSFRILPAASTRPGSPVWLVVGGLGALAFMGGGRAFLRPVTLLLADSQGITVYSGVSASKWNQQNESWDQTRRRGDPCLIPWHMNRDIKEGTIETPVNPQTGKPKGLTLGGTISGHGSKKRHVARTLNILCDASLKLDGFETTGCSIARNGYQEGGLVGMSKAEREGVKPEDFLSCFMLGSTGMNVFLAVAIDT